MTSTECSICQEAVTQQTGRYQTSCGHEFHPRCIVQWLQKPDGARVCPNCRAKPSDTERLVDPEDSESHYSSSSEDSGESEGTIALDDDDTPLITAAKAGIVDRVRELVTAGADVHYRTAKRNTALHFAARRGFVATAILLLNAGAEIDAADEKGKTPLMIACYYAQARFVDLLLKRGANCNLRDTFEPTANALGFAAMSDGENTVVIRRLLEWGVRDLEDAFDIALTGASVSTARLLLEAGVDPNMRVYNNFNDPEEGWTTSLFYSLNNEMLWDLVPLLLQRGADVFATDSDGDDIIYYLNHVSSGDTRRAVMDAFRSLAANRDN